MIFAADAIKWINRPKVITNTKFWLEKYHSVIYLGFDVVLTEDSRIA
jgi:hypothetical protein